MKTSIKETVKKFWYEHKYGFIMAASLLGIGIVAYAKYKNNAEEKDISEPIEMSIPDNVSNASIESDPYPGDAIEVLECGGEVVENCMWDPELPIMTVNNVPISALGDFGKEVIKMAEGHDLGSFNQDLETAETCVIVNLITPEGKIYGEEKKEEEPAA